MNAGAGVFLFVQLIPQILPRSDMRSPALTFNQTVSAFCFRNHFRFLTSEITSASLLQKSLPLPYFRNHFRFLLQKSLPLPYFRNHFRFLTSEITSASLLQKSLPLPYFRNHFRFLTSEITSASLLPKSLPLPFFLVLGHYFHF
jgi:hypothetical protein